MTNDYTKGDLGHTIQKELLFARYELIDEYRRASGGQTFHCVQLSRLMTLFDSERDAVEDIRRSEENQRAGSDSLSEYKKAYAEQYDRLVKSGSPEQLMRTLSEFQRPIHMTPPGAGMVLPSNMSYYMPVLMGVTGIQPRETGTGDAIEKPDDPTLKKKEP